MRGRPPEFDRDRALEACMNAFWERGFEQTGLAELESCTGLGRQSLYNAFGDKKELFEEALSRYQELYIEPIIARLNGSGSSLENVESVLDLWESRGTTADKGCLFANSLAELGAREPSLAPRLEKTLKRLERAFRTALTHAQSEGELPKGRDPKALARLFATIGQGLAVVGKVRGAAFARDAIRASRALLR